MRLLSLILALGMVGPGKARARARGEAPPEPGREPPPVKQGRRHQGRAAPRLLPSRSPCGLHTVEVEAGVVIVDGRRVHPSAGAVELLGAPTWRGDGRALAWLERGGGETRLVVLPDLAPSSEPMAWPVPHALSRDRVHWVASNRVVIGPEALQPRAVASWD